MHLIRHLLAVFLLYFVVAVFVVIVPSAPASASDGYAQVWGGLALANANIADADGQWGPGAQFGGRVGMTDFWSIVGGVDASYHFAGDEVPSSEALGFFGGARYNLDVFQYVPYVGLAIENFLLIPQDDSGDSRSMLGGKFSVGVDWRYSRSWSVGGVIELHAPLAEPSDFPIYSTAGFNLAYHFRL